MSREEHRTLLRRGEHKEVAARAVKIESRTNLLFSFEKMGLRDAFKTEEGAGLFSKGLFDFLYGGEKLEKRFARWCEIVGQLPRKQTRVLTWPVVTVFGFIAQPETHIFLKPKVTRLAAEEYGFAFEYRSRPEWSTYANILDFAEVLRRDLRDLRPRDMMDLQSFMWVMGSDEYPS